MNVGRYSKRALWHSPRKGKERVTRISLSLVRSLSTRQQRGAGRKENAQRLYAYVCVCVPALPCVLLLALT